MVGANVGQSTIKDDQMIPSSFSPKHPTAYEHHAKTAPGAPKGRVTWAKILGDPETESKVTIGEAHK